MISHISPTSITTTFSRHWVQYKPSPSPKWRVFFPRKKLLQFVINFSTPLDPPMRPLYWLFRVAITSLQISCNSIAWCMVWLEKTGLYRCFQRIQSAIGLTNSNTTWARVIINLLYLIGKMLLLWKFSPVLYISSFLVYSHF